MTRYLHIIFFSIILNVSFLIVSCKKEAIEIDISKGAPATTSIADHLLFTIKESNGAVLDVKSHLGSIIIYNQKLDTHLPEGSSYKITDSYGGSYEFTSSTIFGSRTVTGLFGLAKIFRNNVLIYEDKYDVSDNFHTCGTIDSYVPSESPQTSATGASSYYWPNGSIITVNFFNNTGSAYIQQKIQQYAHKWEQYANIKFRFVKPTEPAQIRIEIDNNRSSYVTGIGIQLTYPYNSNQQKPNMHYGWLTNETKDEEFSRVVVHEFGHALGLEHEHRHPNAPININEYFLYLIQKNNWSYAQAQAQAAFFTSQDEAVSKLEYSTYDPLSIMHYYVPAMCTYNKVDIGGNISLSAGDIASIGKIYPSPSTIIYTINNDFGIPQIDIARGTNGHIYIINRQPNSSLNSRNQKYLIYTRTKNKNWYRVMYSFSSSTVFPASTSTGITNLGPLKEQYIMIERQDSGQSLGSLVFRER